MAAPGELVGSAALTAGTALAGSVAGVATVALHGLDWGLALATVTCVGALLLLPAGVARVAAAAGWAAVVLGASLGGPAGDVVVQQDVRTLFLLLLGVVLVATAATTWPRGR